MMETSLSVPTMAHLIQLALEQKVSVETLQSLFDLSQQVEKSQAEKEFNHAVLQFQSQCPVLEKTKAVRDRNGNLLYKYAALEKSLPLLQPLLTACGLTYSFDQSQEEDIVTVYCIITHVLGHTITRQQQGRRLNKTGAMSDAQQDVGTTTFLKTRALYNALGIITGDEDTDGNLSEKEEEFLSTDDEMKILSFIQKRYIDGDEIKRKFGISDVSELKSKDAKKLIYVLEQKLENT